jgi:hypothetical protein
MHVETYLVSGLLLLVALLVSSSLGLVGSALLLVQGLPLLAKNLADLACELLERG